VPNLTYKLIFYKLLILRIIISGFYQMCICFGVFPVYDGLTLLKVPGGRPYKQSILKGVCEELDSTRTNRAGPLAQAVGWELEVLCEDE
jgi:hypothetical protein